jgi:hypothetical protein
MAGLIFAGSPLQAAAKSSRPCTLPAASRQKTDRSSSTLAAALKAGRSITWSHITLCGDLNLNNALVNGLFECRDCVIVGKLLAEEATFKKTVDLSGVHAEQLVNMRGVIFDRPVLFDEGPKSKVATFDAAANFSLATFGDFASFRGAVFKKRAVFDLARFRSDVTFAPDPDGDTATFAQSASFQSALFADNANFTQAEFDGSAYFNDALFDGDARFLAVTFSGVYFDDARIAQSLDLTGVSPSSLMSFMYTSANTLSFRDAQFSTRGLDFTHASIRTLILDVPDVSYVKGSDNDREAVLGMIEASALRQNDLGLANDAEFQQRVLASKHYDAVVHWLDVVFYRWIAGYLVRPWHPLIVLLIIGFGVFIARVSWRVRNPAGPVDVDDLKSAGTGDTPSRPKRLANRVAEGGNALLDTTAAALPGRAAANGAESARFVSRTERFVFRALIVCVLIGLANSNPTLRQVLNSLF